MLRYTDIFKHDLVVLSVECSYKLQYKKCIIIIIHYLSKGWSCKEHYLMSLIESYAYQAWINLIKNTAKSSNTVKYYYNFK